MSTLTIAAQKACEQSLDLSHMSVGGGIAVAFIALATGAVGVALFWALAKMVTG